LPLTQLVRMRADQLAKIRATVENDLLRAINRRSVVLHLRQRGASRLRNEYIQNASVQRLGLRVLSRANLVKRFGRGDHLFHGNRQGRSALCHCSLWQLNERRIACVGLSVHRAQALSRRGFVYCRRRGARTLGCGEWRGTRFQGWRGWTRTSHTHRAGWGHPC
jgi:hypothetical protein